MSFHGAAKVRLGSICAQGGLVACGFRAVWCPAPWDLNGIFLIDFCGKFRWFFEDLEAGDITIEFAKKIMPILALNSIL